MDLITLKDTDIKISPLILGTWVFGGDSWSGADDEECMRAISSAIDLGINCIDTAPVYSWGDSERIVGKALKGKRDKVVIATKCGLRKGRGDEPIDHDLSPSQILNEIEGSLRRLKTDYIDLYQCHSPDEKVACEDVMATLLKLKDQGKIRAIGVSNYSAKQVGECLESAPIVTCQDQYSLLDRKIEEELIPFTKEKGVGVLAYGVLAGGILTGKYAKPRTFPGNDARNFFYHYYQGDAFDRVVALIERLQVLGRPLSELSINWARQQPGIAGVIVGCRNVEQVERNVKAVSWDLDSNELKRINEELDREI
ncbi:MAG: methylglyoxal reductase [Lysobacterales bacterium]|jgi:methylglyoxal reductase